MIKRMFKENNVRNIVFGILSLVMFVNGFAQNGETISNDLDGIAKKIFMDMNNRDFDAILDMTHPKVFDFVPKDQMKTVLKSMFEGTDQFSIEIPETIPEYKLSKTFSREKNNLKYAFLSYDMKMKMTFHDQEFDDDSKKMMTSAMQAKDMDVNFISNNSMDVLMNDRVTIIMKDDSTANKWVMINYDPDSPLFYQVLSSEVMEAAKAYKQDLMLESKKKSDN